MESVLCGFTCVLVSQAQQLRLPRGELSDGGLHLSPDVLQALCDGRPAVRAADTRGRGEELLHARHLSRYGSQLVEGRAARVEMGPVGECKEKGICCCCYQPCFCA